MVLVPRDDFTEVGDQKEVEKLLKESETLEKEYADATNRVLAETAASTTAKDLPAWVSGDSQFLLSPQQGTPSQASVAVEPPLCPTQFLLSPVQRSPASVAVEPVLHPMSVAAQAHPETTWSPLQPVQSSRQEG